MINLYTYQKKFLEKFNKILKKISKDPSAFNYFTFGVDVTGTNYIKFKIFGFKHFKGLFINYLKFLFLVFVRSNIKAYGNQNLKKFKKSNKLILSWSYKNDFSNTGEYRDKYFNISSKNKNLIWFSVYMDKELPKKFDENVILIKEEKFNLFISIFNFVYYLFCVIVHSRFNFCKALREMSYFSYFSNKFLENFKKKINLDRIKDVLIAYEAQPYQKNLIKHLKKNNKKINIVGYDHTAPQPLPINFYYDQFSPNKLLVCSKNKFNFNIKHLNWPKKKLKIIPSIRFYNLKKIDYSNKIYLPYMLKNNEIVGDCINDLIIKDKIKNINNFEIQNHPDQNYSKKHIKLIKQIQSIQNLSFSRRNIKDKDVSIFIGNSTIIPICVELGIKCFHVCLNINYDFYSKEFWNGIKIERINENVFLYTKKKKNVFIKLSKNKNNFKKI